MPDNDKHIVVIMGPEVKAVFNEKTGVTSNFYGGKGAPDGPGHGHIDVDTSGNVTFVREADED